MKTKIVIRVFNTLITIEVSGASHLTMDKAVSYVKRLRLSETASVKELLYDDGTSVKNKDYVEPTDVAVSVCKNYLKAG